MNYKITILTVVLIFGFMTAHAMDPNDAKRGKLERLTGVFDVNEIDEIISNAGFEYLSSSGCLRKILDFDRENEIVGAGDSAIPIEKCQENSGALKIEKPLNSKTPVSSEEELARRKTDIDQRIKEVTDGIQALTNYDPRISPGDYKILGDAIRNLDRLDDPLELVRPPIWCNGPHGESFSIAPRPKIPQAQSGESFDR